MPAMLLREVEYARPETVDEAVRLLASRDNARPLAGGQSLVNVMKVRVASPDVVVDIGRIADLKRIAWYDRSHREAQAARLRNDPNAWGRETHEVGLKEPNAFGLYDGHGNVDEWVSDFYEEEYYVESPSDDPTGPEDGYRRVVRGGSWGGQGEDCRAAVRIGYDEDHESERVGMRVAMTAGEVPAVTRRSP